MVCNVIMVFSNILSPPLYWGSASDGSLVFSDDRNVLQDGCDKYFAPFPPGCMFWNAGGLQSFEHPLHKMQAVARVDSEGQMCGATFRVDKWVRNTILHSYEGVLDPAIFSDATESRKKKIKKVMGLALVCTRHDPQSRPSMKDVVETLIQIKSFETHNIPQGAHHVFCTDNV